MRLVARCDTRVALSSFVGREVKSVRRKETDTEDGYGRIRQANRRLSINRARVTDNEDRGTQSEIRRSRHARADSESSIAVPLRNRPSKGRNRRFVPARAGDDTHSRARACVRFLLIVAFLVAKTLAHRERLRLGSPFVESGQTAVAYPSVERRSSFSYRSSFMTAQQRPRDHGVRGVTPTRAGAHPRKCTVRADIMGPTRTPIVHLWLKPPVKRSVGSKLWRRRKRRTKTRMSTRGRRGDGDARAPRGPNVTSSSLRWYSLSRIRTRDYVDDGRGGGGGGEEMDSRRAPTRPVVNRCRYVTR